MNLVATVNEEPFPRLNLQFLNGLYKRVMRRVKYDNLTSAVEAVRRGPVKCSQNLQSRLITGEEVRNETLRNRNHTSLA